MQKIYPQQTAGGKGNIGMFIERKTDMCAAGEPSAHAEQSVADCLRYYSLQDEVGCLLGDSIKPDLKSQKLPPLRKQHKDFRHGGPFTEGNNLINPYPQTKFQTLVEDLKNTVYSSYWKKRTGAIPDLTPYLPRGYDHGTMLGKKTPYHDRLYDIILPIDPLPDKTPTAKQPAHQTDRKYCRPPFDPDFIYGKCMHVYNHGKWVKACLTDGSISLGRVNNVLNKQEVDFYNSKRVSVGKVLEPYKNISCVPPGYSFGKLNPSHNIPECLTFCRINPERELLKKCLGHLNSLRKSLKKLHSVQFFTNMYTDIKYLDKSRSGWLPRQFVYGYCKCRHILLNPSLLEPLLTMFHACDGTQICYKTFVNMINHTVPTPELPKVWDIPKDCVDYRTTYSEMIKPDQLPSETMRAGLPSARYLDLDYPITPENYCKADKSYLSQESDARICLNPSVLTTLGISHRDMFAPRTSAIIRKVFEATGEKITDETFEIVWNAAKNEHSQGIVCYETFRKALQKLNCEEK